MRPTILCAALVAAGLALPAQAAPTDAQIEKLIERIEKLEKHNAEMAKQLKSFNDEREQIAKGLESPRMSQYEPELTARLKAVENDALEMKKSARLADKLEGIGVSAALTTLAQRASGLPSGIANAGSQLNYRADVSVELPLDAIGDIEQKAFAHVRIGQGQGMNGALGNLGHFASAPNAVAFRASGANPDDSVAILGQAWYQAAIPLPFGGFRPHSREMLELTFGKMDIFGFFDQNAAAGDESLQFLNSVFVHNPLLDAGGEVAVDANGFQPGFIASYANEVDKVQPWRLSLGVFGAGDKGANYQRSLAGPLLMVQAERQLKLFGGLTGNYRAYAWTRHHVFELDGVTTRRHTGMGVSVDQRVGDGVTLFGRYGHLAKGELPFDKSLAVGADFNGSYWDRGGDTLGIGASWLKSSGAFRAAGGSGDLEGDGVADFNYTPSGAEKVAEIYYRYRISPQFSLTPDLQWSSQAGANSEARSVKVLSLRANIAY